jgi:glycosyltransferase involved in cell wall biosynthesis
MRVLSVYRTYFPDPPGGMLEAIRQTCISTKNSGVQNTVFALSPNPQPKTLSFPEAQVIRAKSWIAPVSCDIGGLAAVSEFRKSVQQADLIHFYFPWPFADFLRIASGITKPMMLTYVSDVVRQRQLARLYSPLMWNTLRAMHAVVANSSAYAKSSPVLSNPTIQSKLSVIPLGIHEPTQPQVADLRIFDRLGLDKSQSYALFVGVLRYYKGLHYLLQAAKAVSGKIVIAGSGPEEVSLQRLAKNLELTNVIFSGQVSDAEKLALMRHCRVVVLPSHLRSEAYGMVLVEASLNSKPMISCEIGTGTSFINLHDETGLVVAPGAPFKLANAVNTLLGDADLALRYGLAARKRYEEHFSGEALGQAYSALYRKLLGSNANAAT